MVLDCYVCVIMNIFVILCVLIYYLISSSTEWFVQRFGNQQNVSLLVAG